jgi:hypothetical protein
MLMGFEGVKVPAYIFDNQINIIIIRDIFRYFSQGRGCFREQEHFRESGAVFCGGPKPREKPQNYVGPEGKNPLFKNPKSHQNKVRLHKDKMQFFLDL